MFSSPAETSAASSWNQGRRLLLGDVHPGQVQAHLMEIYKLILHFYLFIFGGIPTKNPHNPGENMESLHLVQD